MLLRNILATLLSTLRLFGRSETWIAFAVLLIVGVLQNKLRMAAYRFEIDGSVTTSLPISMASSFFGFVGCALTALFLSRAIANPVEKNSDIKWQGWFTTVLLIFLVSAGVEFLFGYFAFPFIGPERFTIVDSWFLNLLVWLLFLPSIRSVLLARGSEDAGVIEINQAMFGDRMAWLCGFAFLLAGLAFAQVILAPSDATHRFSMTVLVLLAAFRFALTNMFTWLFVIAAADALKPTSETEREVFA